MAQKRRLHVKTASGLEEQLVASSADIVEIEPIDGLGAANVQEALESLVGIANEGGVTGVKGSEETEYRQGQVNITKDNIGLGNVTNDAQVKRSEMGVAGGVATLDYTGKVPSTQLPSYVDDIIVGQYNSTDGKFYSLWSPTTGYSNLIEGENGKIYVDTISNKQYRWSGSAYVEISSSLALGETSSTAYAGDKGKALADNVTELQNSMSSANLSISKIERGEVSVGWAETADKLSNEMQFNLFGDVEGAAKFDGSQNVSITASLTSTGVTAGTYSAVAVDAKGRVTAGNQIVEWGASGQVAPSASLAVGGLFFALVE